MWLVGWLRTEAGEPVRKSCQARAEAGPDGDLSGPTCMSLAVNADVLSMAQRMCNLLG